MGRAEEFRELEIYKGEERFRQRGLVYIVVRWFVGESERSIPSHPASDDVCGDGSDIT